LVVGLGEGAHAGADHLLLEVPRDEQHKDTDGNNRK